MVLTAKVGIPLAWTQIVSVTNHTSAVQSKCLVVVTNGVCIGHPCCMVHDSQVLLSNNWDCFCLTHAKLENICSIIGCNKQVVAGHLTCADPVHQHVESHHWDKCQSHFQLHDCLQCVHAIQLSHHTTNSRALPQLAVADESHMSHHVVLVTTNERKEDLQLCTNNHNHCHTLVSSNTKWGSANSLYTCWCTVVCSAGKRSMAVGMVRAREDDWMILSGVRKIIPG